MFLILIFIFIFIPLIELATLLHVGTSIGVAPTIAVVVLTGILGATISRAQGMRVMMEIQVDMAKGIPPTDKLLDGVLIFMAGVVLLMPGFITDIIGFFVLWPTGRSMIKRWASKFILGQIEKQKRQSNTVYFRQDEV